MATQAFYARGDSSATNTRLRVQPVSTTPTTLLTFSSGTTGDLFLEPNGGLADPDTTVIIAGVTYSFTVQYSANLSTANRISNVNGVDLRGKQIVVVTVSNGRRYFFLTDKTITQATMQAFPPGNENITNQNTTAPVLVCFLRGTMIETPFGERAVEKLSAGDTVLNAQGTPVTILWCGSRRVTPAEVNRYPELRPICIPAGFFGAGRPYSDLHVSPQHRIAVSAWVAEVHFASELVLVPAKHLLGGEVTKTSGDGPFDYYHLLFDDHEVVVSNGLPTESFQPNERNLAAMDAATRRELELLFPEVLMDDLLMRLDCGTSLRAHEAKLLVALFSNEA